METDHERVSDLPVVMHLVSGEASFKSSFNHLRLSVIILSKKVLTISYRCLYFCMALVTTCVYMLVHCVLSVSLTRL